MEVKAAAVRRLVLTAASPVLPAIGKIQVPLPRLIDEEDVFDFERHQIAPGAIFLCRKRAQLSNVIIPGEWKHVAVYLGERPKRGLGSFVVEAVWPRVRVVPLARFMQGEDYLDCKVPLFTDDPGVMRSAAVFAESLEGLPYDLLVEYAEPRAANKAFYCSEVAWWSYNQVFKAAGLKSPFVPRLTMGAPTVTPDDFDRAVDKWKSVWSRPRIIR